MKKVEPMKARGVRFSSKKWNDVKTEARKDETGKTKPSDVIRHAVDELFKPL